jgi:hypothetical protein
MSGLAVGARVRVKDSHGTASAGRTGEIIGRPGGPRFYWRVRLDDLASTWLYPDSSLELLGDVWGPPTGPMVYTSAEYVAFYGGCGLPWAVNELWSAVDPLTTLVLHLCDDDGVERSALVSLRRAALDLYMRSLGGEG